MARVQAQTAWVREISALTVAPGRRSIPDGLPADPLPAAELLVGRLLRLAGAVAAGHRSADRTCRLHEVAGGSRACALAELLAGAAAPEPQQPVLDEVGLRDGYLEALLDAAAAVRLCRTTQHASGRCWFSEGAPHPADLCGQVLTVAHGLHGRSG